MQLHEEKIRGVRIVRIAEQRLDATVASELKTEMLRLVEQEGDVHVLLDLKQVEYVDSSGLGALLFGHRKMKTTDGKLKLMHLNPKVSTLIKIAQLETVLEHFDDEREAIDSFAP